LSWAGCSTPCPSVSPWPAPNPWPTTTFWRCC
jgi:hypothetical protein